jgi:DNA (cytosine-5)-methyltransferase 1
MLLNSADYGVPQSRERMFLVGIRNAGIFQHPNPTTDKHITVREALKSLPDYGMPGNDSICRAKITFARNPVIRKSPFAGMLFNGQGRPIDLDATCQTLPASMGGNRTPIIDQRSLTCNEEPWIVKYHAKLVDGIQDNLTVPTFLRRLTVEEASLLQGFPIGMKFYGSQCSKFRQIGNSVPPALGAAVAKKIKQALLLYDNKVKVQHVQRIGLI